MPVTVVGGFLGAGKTTLLNHLLRHPEGRRLGVLVNDFGSINVDAELVVGVAGDMVQLDNGCICCSIRDDLVEGIQRVLEGPEPPDHVIIEASGVSDPRSIAATLEQRVPREIAVIDAVVVVVDVDQHLQLGRRERILAGGQVVAADILVLNKIDLVDEAALEPLEAKLRRQSRGGRVLRATHGRIAPALVLGVAAFDRTREAEGEPLEVHVHEAGEGHEAGDGHEHDDHEHDGHEHDDHGGGEQPHLDHALEFWTWSFRTQRPLSSRRLRRAINELPASVVRAKGTVYLASHPEQRAVMHVVGRRAELRVDAPWGEHAPSTKLVLIGSGEPLSPQTLEPLFRACEVELGQEGALEGMKDWVRWVRRVLPTRRAG